MKVDLNRYKEFVAGVTSEISNDPEKLVEHIRQLTKDHPDLNVSLLLTGGIGLASEGGEFDEIVKKILFQGKPWNEETRFHLIRELSDIIWYWTTACRAIGIDPNDVLAENVNKLESRYPGGKFDVFYSENRKEGDL